MRSASIVDLSCQRGILSDSGVRTDTQYPCSNQAVFAAVMTSAAELEKDLVNTKEELELMAKKERESRVSL